jgi:hypothetical protein
MTMREFIRKNRAKLDEAIDRAENYGRKTPIEKGKRNDNDRQVWILNDEGLYRWARSEGVPI